MSTAQDVLDAISAQKTIVGGLKVYVDDLRQKLRDALAAGQLVTQAQLDQIFADVSADNQAVADAMVDNVPVP
jgi:methanogenic corrinoid protein MtbC1